jgi:hypothetical protein
MAKKPAQNARFGKRVAKSTNPRGRSLAGEGVVNFFV